MRAVLFSTMTLVLIFLISTPNALAVKHHKHSAPVTTSVFAECEKIPAECPMIVDRTFSCKAVSGKQSLEEGAQDSDNASCVKMRLQKKICAKGWASEKFKVTCR